MLCRFIGLKMWFRELMFGVVGNSGVNIKLINLGKCFKIFGLLIVFCKGGVF